MEMKSIRNFCIIAHIDHGKSTLADRLLELTSTLGARDMENQVLDNMDLEREKGITIKSHAIQMVHTFKGEQYKLNLIDTPGHVDFSYEVSRSIASCEGALLVVDASQGVQAQTISNLYMAIDHGLEIIPVLNKIDMESAQVELVTDEICDLIGCAPEDVFKVSARTGEGVAPILDAIVEKIPAPQGDPDAPLQALIFDSVFNSFRDAFLSGGSTSFTYESAPDPDESFDFQALYDDIYSEVAEAEILYNPDIVTTDPGKDDGKGEKPTATPTPTPAPSDAPRRHAVKARSKRRASWISHRSSAVRARSTASRRIASPSQRISASAAKTARTSASAASQRSSVPGP